LLEVLEQLAALQAVGLFHDDLRALGKRGKPWLLGRAVEPVSSTPRNPGGAHPRSDGVNEADAGDNAAESEQTRKGSYMGA